MATASPKSSPPPLRVRKRSDPEGDTNSASMPPLPLVDNNYTPEVLKERLAYAKMVLHDSERKLTPIGARALKLYENACERLLDLEDGEIGEQGGEELEEMKSEWKSTLRTFEQSMQYTACMIVTRSSDAQQLQDQLLLLQKAAFYARYGDVLAHVCKQLKAQAESRKVDGWEMLQKRYWTDIDANLQEEKPAYNRVLAGELAHNECLTHLAVAQACRHVGLNFNDMIQAIHLYSERNQVVHAGIISLIKDGFYMDLAKRLHDDFCDIPLLISADDANLIELMQHLVETIIDLLFDCDETEPDNYQMWAPTKELKDRHKQLRAGNSAPIAIQKDMNTEITKRVRQRLREAEEQKEVTGLSWDLGLILGNKSTKRVASSTLEAENNRVKCMKRDWSKIVKLVSGIRNMSDTYFENYGELAAPPEIVHDPSLDD